MPFPRKLLNEGEEIVLDLHPHWWYFAVQLAALLGSLVLGVIVATSNPSGTLGKVTGVTVAVLILGCLVWFGSRYAQWVTTNFVVTTDRLIYRHGVLAKHGIEIPLERVNTVFFGQSIFERILRTGDLVIESAGEGGRQAFSNVRHPSAVQNEIYKQMEENENRKFDRIGREAREGDDTGSGSLSIPEQIRQLDELRKEGVVSEEEFKLKKQQLLDRM
ncbi:MAG TPA: PH domain-containing protein [Acidimicrobiales bacterium]